MKFKKLIGSFPPLSNNRLRNFRVVNPKPNAQGLPSQKLIDVEDKDLRCYIRFEETLKDLIPAGISGSATTKTLTYRALPSGNTEGEVGVQRIVFNDYSAARFDDSESKYALLTFDSADNDIHFPRLSGTEDQTFTFSFFYKNDPSFESGSDSTTQYFFAKSTANASYATNIEYECYFDKGTPGSYKIYLRLIGPGALDHIQNAFSVPDDFAVNKWEHLTFTYDGGQDGADIKLYINGKENTDSTPGSNGTFLGMKRSATQLMIGTKYDTGTSSYSNQLCGYMAEFMVFASHFDANEAYALYSAVARDYYLPRSGYITNPTRVILGERDSATGSYPTVARMGDERRTGEYNVFYDDTNTIVFDSPFATATITFNTLDENFSYRPELGTVIGITGSNSASNFEIISSNPLVGPTLTAGNVGVEFPFYNISAETNTQGNQQLLTIRRAMNKALVINFCDAVNNQNLGLKVKKISDNSVKLTQTKPGEAYNTPIVIVLPAGSDVVSVSQEQGQLLQIPNLVIPGINTPVSFSGGKDYTVNYPTKLHNQHSGYQQLGVATPNVLADINTHGESKSGISDVHITFTPGEDMGAFRDSYFPDYNTAFMNQGIDPNLYQGFSSKLKNKTVIQVPVSTDLETDLGYNSSLGSATPSSDTSGKGQQLMAYMNFSTKRWERIGHPFHVNNVSSANATVENLIANVTSSCIGFGPFQLIATGSDNTLTDATLYDSQYMRSIGSKIDSYGFPFSAQYHASDDRTVKASSIGITKPFLLEKITFDTTIKMNTFPYTLASGGARGLFSAGVCYPNAGNGSYVQNVLQTKVIIPTFFILRQKKGNFSTEVIFDDDVGSVGHLTPVKFQSNIPKTQIISPGAQPTYVDTTRELITFGQVCLISSASQAVITAASSPKSLPFSTNDILNSGLSKEYNVVLNDQSLGAAYTGSIHMEMTVKMAQQYPRVHGFHFRETGTKYKSTLGNQRNSRSAGFLEESNRALFNGFGGKVTTSSLLLPAERIQSGSVPISLPANQIDLTSPFLIMPEDNLILGWQYPVFGDSHDANLGSGDTKWAYMTIGGGKLNFYGSQIRDGVEFHDTLNQPLTSDAIHESIHYDNPVVDQFDIETSYEYSGSYIARARGGDDNTSFFFLPRLGINTRSNYFGHNISSVVEPHLSSSFNRFVTMTSNESYLDSYPPNPLLILNQIGASSPIQAGNRFYISYSAKANFARAGERVWNRIFPFTFTLGSDFIEGASNLPVPRGLDLSNFRTDFEGFSSGPVGETYFAPSQIGKFSLDNPDYHNYLALYGIHTQSPSGSVKLVDQLQNPELPGQLKFFSSTNSGIRKFEVQGFKYGLINAVPQKTCAVYRRDRYGQFRDMLEQRKFSVFRETVAAENDYNSPDSVYQEFPVQVYFVDENNDSFLGRYYTDISSIQEKLDSSPKFQSSNISNYCTSSLPYFDDDTPRNRNYPEEFVSFE